MTTTPSRAPLLARLIARLHATPTSTLSCVAVAAEDQPCPQISRSRVATIPAEVAARIQAKSDAVAEAWAPLPPRRPTLPLRLVAPVQEVEK